MSHLSDFLPTVLPFVNDCPDMAAEIAIRFALIEFCEETLWLQHELDAIPVYAGQATYEIETPLDTLCADIVEATLASSTVPLAPKTRQELERMWGDWRTVEGDPKHYTMIRKNDITLVPSPQTNDELRLIVALRPANDAQEVDDLLYDRFLETIAYGARARLKNMRGQPYYDPDSARMESAMFHEGKGKARAERNRDNTQVPLTVQMRRFI